MSQSRELFVNCIVYNAIGQQCMVSVNNSFLSLNTAIDTYKKVPFKNAVLVDDSYFRTRTGYPNIQKVRTKHVNVARRSTKKEDIERSAFDTERRRRIQSGYYRQSEFREGTNENTGNDNVFRTRRGLSASRLSRNSSTIGSVKGAIVIDATDFSRLFSKTKQANYYAQFVDSKAVAELDNCTCIMLENNSGFVAVEKDGNITNVLRGVSCKIKPFLRDAFAHAIKFGGYKLDCYAMGGGGLAYLYCLYGFIPVCKIKFDRRFAPDNWNYDFGEPDIVFFMYCGDEPEVMVRKFDDGVYPKYSEYTYVPYVDSFERTRSLIKPSCDYEFGGFLRDTALDKWNIKYKKLFLEKATQYVKSLFKDLI